MSFSWMSYCYLELCARVLWGKVLLQFFIARVEIENVMLFFVVFIFGWF